MDARSIPSCVNTISTEGAALRIGLFLHACSTTSERESIPFTETIRSLGEYCKQYQNSRSGTEKSLESIVQVFKSQGISRKLQERLSVFQALIEEENPDYENFTNTYLLENNRLLMPKTLSWQLIALTTFRVAAVASFFFFKTPRTLSRLAMFVFIGPSWAYQMYRNTLLTNQTKPENGDQQTLINSGFRANIDAANKEKALQLLEQTHTHLSHLNRVLREIEIKSLFSPWESGEGTLRHIAKVATVAIVCFILTALAYYGLAPYTSSSIVFLGPYLGSYITLLKKSFVPLFRDVGLCTESERYEIPFVEREVEFLDNLQRSLRIRLLF